MGGESLVCFKMTASKRGLFLASLLVILTLATALAVPFGASAHIEDVLIKGIPSVRQSYNLSCEYAAAAAVTLFWGNLISEKHFLREVPESPNPHKGFRGDINGTFGGLTDYGVYAEALVPVLERHAYEATVFYGGVAWLKAELEAGHPVVAWVTVDKNATRPVYHRTYEGDSFKLVPYEHTVVAYGYNTDGLYVMDVGDGGKYFTDWDSFLRRWGYFDEMALLIHPE